MIERGLIRIYLCLIEQGKAKICIFSKFSSELYFFALLREVHYYEIFSWYMYMYVFYVTHKIYMNTYMSLNLIFSKIMCSTEIESKVHAANCQLRGSSFTNMSARRVSGPIFTTKSIMFFICFWIYKC